MLVTQYCAVFIGTNAGPSQQHYWPSGNSSALGPLPTQPLTRIKLWKSIKLNIYLLYWYFQQNQCLNI